MINVRKTLRGGSDFIGFPLPGLSLWSSVRVHLQLPERRP